MAELELPDGIHEYLAGLIRQRWVGGERDPEPVVAALPSELPAGIVTRLVSGGPFGWLIDARLDEVDGRVALEVLEDSRMAGPEHYRVWDDGTTEPLENERIFMVFPKDATAEQKKAVEEDYYAHNRRVGELLRERGFRG